MKQYCLTGNPVCERGCVIQGDTFRLSVLTSSLVRLEYDVDGNFEDRATQRVIDRNFVVPPFDVREEEGMLWIHTEYLDISYDKKPFSARGLTIRIHMGTGMEQVKCWRFGDEMNDLGGTVRTLDEVNGSVPLGHGLLSRDGWTLLDDTRSMLLTDDGWIAPRKGDAADLYFFGYGHRYVECLKDFYHLCGKTPLLPRYVLGNWWSRYHRYTEQEYKELMERFDREHIPFSVAIIDMDWHLVEEVDPKYGTGWTGYTWNRKLFPDPGAFMSWLHDRGRKVALNVHPADGVRAYEDAYERIASQMGIDPSSGQAVEFDPTDPKFMKVYLEELHHPMEEEGVDFWWIDWQQGTQTKFPGLDPLWMLNHYHYMDSSWKGTRPITFSRYAGIGSHRYPVGFSGDTHVTWESLQFQPYFTSTASNVGYGWWSHDIGGHMHGYRDDELMARWTQFGVFSPINRLHSTWNLFSGKEPWKYGRVTQEVMERFLRLRHSLVPYLYTMNRRASREGMPLIQPMYYAEPERQEAYEVPNEYYFGSELIVSPITQPQDKVAQSAGVKTWIPDGMWIDFFTGHIYGGGHMLTLWRGLETIPVLMRAGAIIPMKDMTKYDNLVENPEEMLVYIFPAASGSFTMWEDAGDTPDDREENWASTTFSFAGGEYPKLEIQRAEGNLKVIPPERKWKLVFCGVCDTEAPCVQAGGQALEAAVQYEPEGRRLTVELPFINVREPICVTFPKGLPLSKNDTRGELFRVLEKAQMSYDEKMELFDMVEKEGDAVWNRLDKENMNAALYGEFCEILSRHY